MILDTSALATFSLERRTGDQTERCVGSGLLAGQNCSLLQNGEQSSRGGRRLWHGRKAQIAPVAEMK